jgi:GNAT superfamily N-acetyltransferase
VNTRLNVAEGITIELRPATAADGSFLAEMLMEAVNWHPDRRLPASQVLADPQLSHYVAGWPRPDDGGVVAVAAGHPIGAAWWRFFPEADAGYGFVAGDVPELSMAVAATWRGKGVGRVLLRAAKQTVAPHCPPHCRRISLSVERANGARSLYASEGFRVLSSGRDSDTMICDLGVPSRPRPGSDRRS